MLFLPEGIVSRVRRLVRPAPAAQETQKQEVSA